MVAPLVAMWTARTVTENLCGKQTHLLELYILGILHDLFLAATLGNVQNTSSLEGVQGSH